MNRFLILFCLVSLHWVALCTLKAQTYFGPKNQIVHALAIQSESNRVFAAHGTTISIWSIDSLEQSYQFIFNTHDNKDRALELVYDESRKWLIIGTRLGKMIIWDALAQQQVGSWQISSSPIQAIAVAREQILIGNDAGQVIHFAIAERKKVKADSAAQRAITAICVDSTNTQMILGTARGEIMQWHQGKWETLWQQKSPIVKLDYSTHTKTLSVASQREIFALKLQQEPRLLQRSISKHKYSPNNQLTAAHFHRENKTLYANGSQYGTIQLFTRFASYEVKEKAFISQIVLIQNNEGLIYIVAATYRRGLILISPKDLETIAQ